MKRATICPLLAMNAVVVSILAGAAPAHADTVSCQKTIASKLFAIERVVLKLNARCLDKLNAGDVTSCPDAITTTKIDTVRSKVTLKIAAACTMADLASLGFPTDCAYETGTQGVEASCAALPVTTPTEFAACLECWKEAELKELVALLYASHAVDVCGGALDETSSVCSDLDCTTPLPEQHVIKDTAEYYCQKNIGKAGIVYALRRIKFLEKCVLTGLGTTRADCLTAMQLNLDDAEAKKIADKNDPARKMLFEQTDVIRRRLADLKVTLEDRPGGTGWRRGGAGPPSRGRLSPREPSGA